MNSNLRSTMRSLRPDSGTHDLPGGYSHRSHRRRGSTLLIVLTLLGMLALLGVLFYTFAAQERATAGNFSSDARVLKAPSLEPDLLIDYALEQLILGPDDTRVNSALWGGRHALIPNMLGRDGVPFNGEGVHIIDDGTGSPQVDLNYDGTPDNTWLLGVNNSPAANNGLAFGSGPSGSGATVDDIPSPNVDYTYAGFDHLFLAHRALVPDFNNPAGPPVEVILPSFHRPGLLNRTLREIDDSTLTSPRVETEFWFGASSTANRIFRPHRDHRYMQSSGNMTSSRRFVRPAVPSDPTADQATLRSLGINSFFPAPPDIDRDNIIGEQGAYEVDTVGGTTARSSQYEYDVDLDGDGVRESILLDLDFAPQRRGDGKLVVPMFAYHVLDANGLINLNVAGNLAGNIDFDGLDSREFGNELPNNPAFVSRSNLGFSVSEINPLYALSADPADASLSGSDLDQHKFFLTMFGHNDVPRSRMELANLEWLFLNIGRPGWNSALLGGTTNANEIVERITSIMDGRYGEIARLRTALADAGSSPATVSDKLPFAGLSENDDNGNYVARFPHFGTPVDLTGTGNPFQTGGLKLRKYRQPNSPVAFQQFDGYEVGVSGMTGDVEWYNVFTQALMTNSRQEGRLDEPAELIVDSKFTSDDDSIFTVDDTVSLHLGRSDLSRLGNSSRVLSLATANFRDYLKADNNDPDSARQIRERFTTISNDRREFSQAATIQTANKFRSWESERFDGTNYIPEFPPTFPGAGGNDPFRNVTRNLLGLNGAERVGRFKLDLNRILSDSSGTAQFRRFTDYAENDNRARVERQQMARDIYVLLYTFCGGSYTDPQTGSPNSNLTNQPASTYYRIPSGAGNPDDLRKMAQFAVNIVDAVDRDDVMTEFWYDADLSDGWNNPDHRVFGVERQVLAFSEALAVRTPNLGMDHMATMFNENTPHDYLFLELINLSTDDVTLYDGTTESWRLRRDDDASVSGVDPGEYALSGSLEASSDPLPRGTLDAQDCIINFRDSTTSITPSGRYVIASQDGSVEDGSNAKWSSEIRVDTGSGFVRVLPAVADMGGMTPSSIDDNPGSYPPAVDLDLCHDSHSGRFTSEVAMSATNDAGCLVRQGGSPVTRYRLRLERKCKGYRDAGTPQETNGWAIVDKSDVEVRTTWSYMNSSTATEIQTSLNDDVNEQYRVQPLRRMTGGVYFTDRPVSNNTFKTTGTPHDPNEVNDINQIDVQLHFDRDLMSIAELLYIPTFAPRDLTNGKFDPTLDYWDTNIESFGLSYLLNTSRQVGGGSNTGNRWYRLLNFVEVTPTIHRQQEILDDSALNATNEDQGMLQGFGRPVLPGSLNPNTIRHPQVLAGLLDDKLVFDGFTRLLDAQDSADTPGTVSMARAWWEEFLASRDGFDDVSGLTLPGTSAGNPFRALGHLGGAGQPQLADNSALECTMFRGLPADLNAAGGDPNRYKDSRRLFEVGTSPQHANNELHPYARYRFLQKILNNSTTRSNTFLVYVGVQFHEAAIDGNGAVRIGGRLDDTPLHRGFFVIDRSEAVEQVKRMRLNGRTMDHDGTLGILKPKNLPTGSSVDYYSYRALSDTASSTNPDGIDWRALIKFRQLLN